MRGKFGWDLPPGVSHHMIEEQAGAFEEKEMAPYWQGVETEDAMEKLVEEVRDRFCRSLCGGYNYGERICDCYPRVTWGTAQAQCSCLNDTVDFAITLIGKAYAEGMELPGEVGRTEIQIATRITSGLLAFFQTWVREAITQKKAKILIALRKEKERRE